jgi:hypothetical protein
MSIKYGEDKQFIYSKNFNESETQIITLDKVISEDSCKLVIENCYISDSIY